MGLTKQQKSTQPISLPPFLLQPCTRWACSLAASLAACFPSFFAFTSIPFLFRFQQLFLLERCVICQRALCCDSAEKRKIEPKQKSEKFEKTSKRNAPMPARQSTMLKGRGEKSEGAQGSKRMIVEAKKAIQMQAKKAKKIKK